MQRSRSIPKGLSINNIIQEGGGGRYTKTSGEFQAVSGVKGEGRRLKKLKIGVTSLMDGLLTHSTVDSFPDS